MIVFDLKCAGGHIFEAWFRSSEVYENQRAASEINCPVCGDAHISKAIMAPNISAGKGGDKSEFEALAGREARQDSVSVASPVPPSLPEDFKKALEGMRQMVRDNCEDVGKNFAEEAKKIHYGEAEKRGIYGEATPEESEDLRDEGIDFMQLPIPLRTDS
jgi:hypothetical protein